MSLTKHKPLLRWAPLGVLFFLAFIQSCKKDPHTMTTQELERSIGDSKTYASLLSYAEGVGIDTKPYQKSDSVPPVMALLEEIAYGKKPDLRYIEKDLPADTAILRAAAEDLVTGSPVTKVTGWLQPSFAGYVTLQKEYAKQLEGKDRHKSDMLAETLNAYRWMKRQSQHAPRMVMVNIQGAYLKALDSTGTEVLFMRTVVGKGETPTPTMDTYATSIVTHPYWNVPKSIAEGEMLPKVLADENYLSKNNIQVVGEDGEVVNPEDINWNKIDRKGKFPYRFRQETGEDNSLGLLKVEMKNPLAIYLHDTNARYLFKSEQRWRSHGCVRVQQPTELANFMAGKELLESNFLTEPDTTARPPKWNKLSERIPVFLFYLGVDTDANGRIIYLDDVYKKRSPEA
ncbi:L,D-transpeptidase family protein [Dyadobacter tibetensis]|uniref:L,D-transpeptidase family protein n=1 Tax=Dyadobacter tibetensis TaxID=1211851 RepID=UPI000470BAC9|nr:L,D-transpeptidase family protein [Dyadobacter tibetensis]